jgi:stringent starvation protein B
MIDAQGSSSTRPYLIRALYEWCTDNGLTPYVAVQVDDSVQVPHEYVKDGEIVLNVSFDATSGLELGNEFIAFSARFAGKPRDIMIPVDRVIAIYARENGQGMAFPRPAAPALETTAATDPAPPHLPPGKDAKPHADTDVKLVESVPPPPSGSSGDKPAPDPSTPKKRPKLTRIK